MSRLHINTVTTITLDTGIDVSAATTKQILYERPDGTRGAWDASVVDNNYLRYETSATDVTIVGKWYFMTKAIINSKPYHGDRVVRYFYDVLS